jgi:beta-fructofuranosidase
MTLDVTARAGQHLLAQDLHRPQYHFLPPANWMNDPNGMIQWRGQYHLFYQYNPHGPFHGTIHWGHAVSPDLVHWRHLPVALAPTPDSADEDGCWSGVAVDHDGVATIIYSGARRGVQRACLATSTDDDLATWEKYGGNPIIAEPPADIELVAYRDHSVWQEEDGWWYQLMGAGIVDAGGAVLLYRSHDLRQWEYLHPLLVGDATQTVPVHTGTMWECPSFFPLGRKHVLIVSVWDDHRLHYPVYIVGTYADHRFTPEHTVRLDLGDNHFYAPQTMIDDQGRRIMFGWVREAQTTDAQQAAGWSGVMSLPRALAFGDDGHLRITPVPELQALRGTHQRVTDQAIDPAVHLTLPDLPADQVELLAEIDPGTAQRVGITVQAADSAAVAVQIAYDCLTRRVVADQRQNSAEATPEHEVHAGTLALVADEPLHIHVFLDRSVVEVFVNGRVTYTNRIYGTQAGRLAVDLVAQGGHARLVTLDAWAMNGIWSDN